MLGAAAAAVVVGVVVVEGAGVGAPAEDGVTDVAGAELGAVVAGGAVVLGVVVGDGAVVDEEVVADGAGVVVVIVVGVPLTVTVMVTVTFGAGTQDCVEVAPAVVGQAVPAVGVGAVEEPGRAGSSTGLWVRGTPGRGSRSFGVIGPPTKLIASAAR